MTGRCVCKQGVTGEYSGACLDLKEMTANKGGEEKKKKEREKICEEER